MAEAWPALPLDGWKDTYDTLHRWTQVVGKIRLVQTPWINHAWHSTLYVTARGLTTSLVPHPTGPSFQVDFDLVAHRLEVLTADGRTGTLPLGPRTVADFHADVLRLLDGLDVGTEIWPVPVEIPGAVPFPDDREHAAYDPEAVHRFWQALVEMTRVFTVFRDRFVGKASPVHVFWGALDLAYTRFSGRTAPPHPGGAPNCGPHVMHEAYSHEVSSCGYWPGPPGDEGVFYAYAYPEPAGYRDRAVAPTGARWDDGMSEFVLPYELVRTASDPDAVLLTFLESSYAAAAETADWDRSALERPRGAA
jgi:hypothetical protein